MKGWYFVFSHQQKISANKKPIYQHKAEKPVQENV